MIGKPVIGHVSPAPGATSPAAQSITISGLGENQQPTITIKCSREQLERLLAAAFNTGK